MKGENERVMAGLRKENICIVPLQQKYALHKDWYNLCIGVSLVPYFLQNVC